MTTGRFKNRIGERFGRWLVIATAPKMDNATAWLCRCDCGTERAVRRGALTMGTSLSCGCLKHLICGKHLRTHGARYTTEYTSWRSIHDRCHSPNNPQYYLYGARGIRMCDRWKDFTKFLEDMGHKPTPKHTIDRIDVNGNYEPGNCRWATPLEQGRNKRNTIWVTLGNERMTLGQVADRYDVDSKKLYARVKRTGQPLEVALKAMGVTNV